MSGSVSFYRKELANALENQSIEEISAKRAREILKEHLRKLGQDGDWDVEKDKKVINQLLMEMVQSKNDSVSKKKKKRRRADQESDESDKGDQDGNMVGIRKRQEKKDSEKKHVKKRKSSVPLLKKLRKLCQLKQINLRKLDLSGKDPSEATKVLKSKLIEKGYSSADLASSSIDAVINKAELDKELEELGVAPRENSIREESESISTNRRRSVEKLSSYRDFFSSEEEEEEEADESSQEDSANDSGNETGEDMNSSDNSD